MNIPCSSKIDCGGTDNPIANLSSEAPDALVFFGNNYGPYTNKPPLDSNWTTDSCLGVCESTISQEDADLCAAINALICASNNWKAPPDQNLSGPPTVTPPSPPTIYYNTLQACQSYCPDGAPFTYTVPPGTFAALSQELANQMAFSYACSQVVKTRICMSGISLSEGCQGDLFVAGVSASATSAVTFSVVAGALPPGLSLTPAGSKATFIGGKPTVAGDYTFTLQAASAAGNFMQKQFTISIIAIANDSNLPVGASGSDYSVTLQVTGTTTGALTWAVTDGSLPDGLSLDSVTGVISGTPNANGSSTFTVSVADDTVLCQKQFTLTIGGDCFDSACDFCRIGWGTPVYSNPFMCPSCFSFANVTAKGDTFAFTGSHYQLAGTDGQPGFTLSGSFVYTGPAVDCHLNFILSSYFLEPFGIMQLEVKVTQGADQLMQTLLPAIPMGTLKWESNVDFSLEAGAGDTVTVELTFVMGGNFLPSDSIGAIAATGILKCSPSPPTPAFGNSSQTSTATCVDKSETSTVPMNSFYADTQAEADAMAKTVANSNAIKKLAVIDNVVWVAGTCTLS